MQDAVSAGAPLLAVIGFLVLPVVWSVPEALVTAGGGSGGRKGNGGQRVWQLWTRRCWEAA